MKRMKYKQFTTEEINFLKKQYPILGRKECAKILKRSENSIKNKVQELKIKVLPKIRSEKQREICLKRDYTKKPEEYNVNSNYFTKELTPETVYILGFLWADGYIRNDTIRLELIKEDVDDIKELFDSTGKWNYYTRKRKNRKEQAILHTNNKLIASFLKEKGYSPKTYISAESILQHIPENIKPLWFRGFFDGDGHLRTKYDKGNYQAVISGHIEQNWKFMENLLNNLQISYSISIIKNKKGNSSRISIYNKENINKLCSYLYTGFDDIKTLLRKKTKALKFIEHYSAQ
jgi:hypothetical protein